MVSDGLTGLGSLPPGVSFIADDLGNGSNRTRSEEAVRAGSPRSWAEARG
jgi:hypothetical protein